MKNLFKKLALMLALALVITTIAPVATASASTKTPGLVSSGKILYIGGDYEGKYTDTYTFKFQNTYGLTATWKANNPDIAKMSGKKNTVVAVAPGTATFTITLKNRAGKVVKTTTATVWVRQNADGVGFGSLKKTETPMNVGDSLRIYAYRQLGNTKVWGTEDFSLITDKIVWSSSDKKVATVDAKWGTVKAVGAGEAKITATVVQSNGVKTNLTASYTVTVASGITSIAQTEANKVELTFGTADEAAKVTKADLNSYYLVGSAKFTNYIKDVTCAEGSNKVVVEFYNDLAKNTEYFVEYNGKTVAVLGVDLTVVTGVKITTTSVKASSEGVEVKFDVIGENDVIVNTGADKVELTAPESVDYFFDKTTNKIYFTTAGKTATITATYTAFVNGQTVTFTDKKTIISTASNEVVASTAATAIEENKADLEIKKVDFTKTTTTLAKDDSNYRIFAKLAKTVDGKDASIYSTDVNSKFTFESSNSNVVIVNSVSGELYAVTKGNATIVVKYDGKVIGQHNVVVGDARKLTTFDVKFDKTQLSDATADAITATVIAKDQFGAPVKVTVNVTNETEKGKDVQINSFSTDKDTFSITGKITATKATSIYLKFTAIVGEDELKEVIKPITVCKADASKVAEYKVEISSEADFDMNIEKESDVTDNNVEVKVFKYDANGFKIEEVSLKEDIKAATNSGDMYVVVSNGSKEYPVTISGNAAVFKAVDVKDAKIIKELAQSYTVRVYENVNGHSQLRIVDGFTLVDTTKTVSVTKTKLSSTETTLTAAVNDAFTFAYDTQKDVTVELGATTNYVYRGTTLYVKNVEYAIPAYEGVTYTITVPVEMSITVGSGLAQ